MILVLTQLQAIFIKTLLDGIFLFECLQSIQAMKVTAVLYIFNHCKTELYPPLDGSNNW